MASTSTPDTLPPRKTILDCDNSCGIFTRDIDDGLALLYLLGNPDVDLLGVTLSHGNTRLPAVVRATRRLLSLAAADGLPLHIGAACRGRHRQRSAAAEFLAASANAWPGEIDLIATGPLSNLAAAAVIDPAFFSKVRSLHLMGGYLAPTTLPCRELNLAGDPEAAAVVLGAPCPLYIYSAEVCMQAWFGWRDLPRLRRLQVPILLDIVRWLGCFGVRHARAHFYLWDLLPAMAASRAEIVDYAAGEVASSPSELERGELAWCPTGNVKLATALRDREAFLARAVEAWLNVAARESALANLHGLRHQFARS